MNSIQLSIQGSSKEPYLVSFDFDHNEVKARCNCPQGSFGKLCKHIISLSYGDFASLKILNKDDIKPFQQLFQGSRLDLTMRQLKEKEELAEKLKREIEKLKRNILG